MPRLALGSLFCSPADGFGTIMSGMSTNGSASNEPSATRRQLEELVLTLWKEEMIAIEQGLRLLRPVSARVRVRLRMDWILLLHCERTKS